MSSKKPENIRRGTLCALVVVPLAAIVFSSIWNTVAVAPLVFLAVAWLAVVLYWLGARTISWRGALCITGVMILALAASVASGLVAGVAIGVGGIARRSPFEALGLPQFWTVFTDVLSDPAAQSRFIPTTVVAAAFALLGVVSALRGVFHRQSRLSAHA